MTTETNPNRADHAKHTGYLVPECRECTSPEAIAERRRQRATHQRTDRCRPCAFLPSHCDTHGGTIAD